MQYKLDQVSSYDSYCKRGHRETMSTVVELKIHTDSTHGDLLCSKEEEVIALLHAGNKSISIEILGK